MSYLTMEFPRSCRPRFGSLSQLGHYRPKQADLHVKEGADGTGKRDVDADLRPAAARDGAAGGAARHASDAVTGTRIDDVDAGTGPAARAVAGVR